MYSEHIEVRFDSVVDDMYICWVVTLGRHTFVYVIFGFDSVVIMAT